MNAVRDLHNLPISERPSLSWLRRLNALLWCIIFNLGCLMVHGFQVVFLLPLRALPFKWSRKLYDEGICYTKGAFGCLLSSSFATSFHNPTCLTTNVGIVLMCQWFAPTKLCITFEQEGTGRFSKANIDNMAVKDQHGRVVSLNLPTKFVLISNHQVSHSLVTLSLSSCSTDRFTPTGGIHGA